MNQPTTSSGSTGTNSGNTISTGTTKAEPRIAIGNSTPKKQHRFRALTTPTVDRAVAPRAHAYTNTPMRIRLKILTAIDSSPCQRRAAVRNGIGMATKNVNEKKSQTK
ncbi:MAG: hypothetical protein KDA71_24985 [Planctomycetales bacterium]|nr:hypothetical protein [Planctomycetales bacterium]